MSSLAYAQVATTLEQAEMAGLSPELKADVQARLAKGGQTVYEILKTDMLNNIQLKHPGAFIVALARVPSFASWGIGSYLGFATEAHFPVT